VTSKLIVCKKWYKNNLKMRLTVLLCAPHWLAPYPLSFQDRIRDPSLNAVKASINANHANFTDFDSVKDNYVEFKHTENPTNDPRTRQVASAACGGRGGRSFPCKHDHGQGPQTFDKRQKGLVPQSEVDKQTHIIDRHYSDAEFDRLTPAEKQKLCQLRSVSKTPRLDQPDVTAEGLLPQP
jgi:hypothetical protein